MSQKPKRIPRIIIKKTKKEEKMEKIYEGITHYLTKEKTIQTNSAYKKTKEETIHNCCSEESAEKAYDILKRKLPGTCEIVKEQIIKPKMRIFGIDNFETWT